MSLTKINFNQIKGASANVLDYGADPTGATDSTNAFKAALLAAKGANNTGSGRTVFALYIPSYVGGFYKITDTLTIDGTDGLIVYGDGAYTLRDAYPSTDNTSTIRWYGTTSKPIFQLQGQTTSPSNPNFNIVIRDLTISGYVTALDSAAAIPTGIALSGIHIGNVDGVSTDVLNRSISFSNVSIANCRFGIWSGSPSSGNTDNALVDISNCHFDSCAQAGAWLGTGNALFSIQSCTFVGNGWGTYTADNYATAAGANLALSAGYCDVYSYVSAGAGTAKPITADILQLSGRMSITNAWSDTHGIFFAQNSASGVGNAYQVGTVSGIRHYEGSMTIGTTPTSMSIRVPGTVIDSCFLYGNLEIASALSGAPVCSGINFVRAGAGYTGTGVTTQRSLIALGTAGNNSQMIMGGANTGVTIGAVGGTTPHIVIQDDNPVIIQCPPTESTGTGFSWTVRTDDANGFSELLWNCYWNVATSNYIPYQNTKLCTKLNLGGDSAFTLYLFDPNGSSAGFTAWVSVGGWLAPPSAGYRTQVNFAPPKLSTDPTYSSGNFYLGGMYFNTATNKLRVNVGGTTWQDCN